MQRFPREREGKRRAVDCSAMFMLRRFDRVEALASPSKSRPKTYRGPPVWRCNTLNAKGKVSQICEQVRLRPAWPRHPGERPLHVRYAPVTRPIVRMHRMMTAFSGGCRPAFPVPVGAAAALPEVTPKRKTAGRTRPRFNSAVCVVSSAAAQEAVSLGGHRLLHTEHHIFVEHLLM